MATERPVMCYCGQDRPFEACCQPYLETGALPETAEQLMRSRYTAYALGNVDYIEATEIEADRKSIEDWVRVTRFLGLRVLEAHGGQADDELGRVVFEADYEVGSQRGVHRETSEFSRRDGRWWFVRGRQNPLRQQAKVGRNDPCPCGSGKKAKKCCY